VKEAIQLVTGLAALTAIALCGLGIAVSLAIASIVLASDDAPEDDREGGDAPSFDDDDGWQRDPWLPWLCNDDECERIHDVDGRHVNPDVTRPSTPSDREPHAYHRNGFAGLERRKSYPQLLSDAWGAHIPQLGECVE